MIVVGLTGTYGMGKSTVAKMFAASGAVTLDTDEVVREILKDGAVIDEVKKTFGDDIAEGGTLRKDKLADMVFEDSSLRITLENILHPRVFEAVDRVIAEVARRGGPSVVVVEAPVLFERGYENRFDKIVTVYASEDVAIARLSEKGIPEDSARRRLRSQLSIERKIRSSDFVVDNGRDRGYTEEQVRKIYKELVNLERRLGNN